MFTTNKRQHFYWTRKCKRIIGYVDFFILHIFFFFFINFLMRHRKSLWLLFLFQSLALNVLDQNYLTRRNDEMINPINFQMIEYFSEVELNLRIYVIGMYPFVCLFGFPKFKYLALLTMLGSIFILTGIAVTFSYLIEDFPDPNRLETSTQLMPIPTYCNLFLNAMHNMTVTMPLENRMRTPHNLPRMLILNASFNILLYTSFGFLGYNKYMYDVYDTVVKNLPVDVPWVDVFVFHFYGFSISFFFFYFNFRYAKIKSIFIFLKNFKLMKFKINVILIFQSFMKF